MTVWIQITKELEPWWATGDELLQISDSELIELVMEDVPALLDGAIWDVTRLPCTDHEWDDWPRCINCGEGYPYE